MSNRLRSWIAAPWKHRSARDELEREIRAHLELEMDDRIDDGLSHAEARSAALRAFGNPTLVKEVCQDMRTVILWQQLTQDLRYAWRQVWRAPGLAVTTILTLAIGVGLNTAVFTLLHSGARPLPLKDPDRIIEVFQTFRGRFSRQVVGSAELLSYPEYVTYRDQSHALDGLAAYTATSVAIGGSAPEHARGVLASCNYFQVLHVGTALGRGFSPDECLVPGGSPVTILGYGFWQRRFGGDPAIVGQVVLLNQLNFTVIGVAEREFTGTEVTVPDLWVPVTMQPLLRPGKPSVFSEPNASWLSAIGRLKPGESIRQAQADLSVIARQSDGGYPGRETVVSVEAGAYLNGPEARNKGTFLAATFLTIFGLVLLMACFNIMNLLLGRAAARQREVGIRLAMGAGRMRLVQQMLTESAVLALIGGAAGVLAARWFVPLLLSAIAQPGLRLDVTPDLRILAYALALTGVSTVVSGLAPALYSTRVDLSSLVKREQATSRRGIGGSWLRRGLVAMQVAGCLLLLVVGSLFIRGLQHAQTIAVGFATTDVLAISCDLPQQGYSAPRAAAFYRDLRDRLVGIAGPNAVGLTASLPLVGRRSTSINLAPSGGGDNRSVPVFYNVVSGDYFRAMQVQIVHGRTFADADVRVGQPTPAVVSAAMARWLWPKSGGVGERFSAQATTYDVVGIAEDAHNVDLAEVDGPFFYAAMDPADPAGANIVVHAPGRATAVATAVPDLVRSLDSSVLVTTVRFEDRLADLLQPTRVAARLSLWLGLFALVLACVGIYGVISSSVSQRTQEIGVRKALGAVPASIVWLVISQGARPVLAGVIVGVFLAVAVSQLIKGMLLGVGALDPVAYVATLAAVSTVAVVAMWLPALRAARLDPAVTLRRD